jgi:hypothetical protein
MTNFVMSMASSPSISHAVELASSPFCHYHYSNLTKVLSEWQITEFEFRSFIRPFIPGPRKSDEGLMYYALSHDFTKMLKGHSPCLEGRQYVPISNNQIDSNRALGIGFPVSALHFGAGESGWCPPLALDRLSVDDNSNTVAIKQIESLVRDKMLPFEQELNLLRADSAYGKAIFLAPLYEMDNLALIVRLRPGMKVWDRAADGEPSGGAPRIYGDKYYLTSDSSVKTYQRKKGPCEVAQKSVCERRCDDRVEKETVLGNGRKAIMVIQRWNDMLLRTKQGAKMKDKPIDVLRVQILDATSQQLIFERPLFLAVSGKRKNEISSTLAQEQYRERYDVEPYYRFAKNNLLMDKLQTPKIKHINPWLRIVQLTSWLLFTARQEIGAISCPVWQKYLPKNKAAQDQPEPVLTIAQAQRAIYSLFCTFDQTPFLPEMYKKGKGREKGKTFVKRTRFKVVKKIKKSLIKLKNQQNE